MTRTRKKVLLITGILLAMPVLFLVEEHFRGKWALANLRRELVAKGEKLTVAECRPSTEPVDNGYRDLMSAMAVLPDGDLYGLAPSPLRMVAPGKAMVIQGMVEWARPDSSRKAKLTNSNWGLLGEALEGGREPLNAVRTALLKPDFDPHMNYSLVQFQMPPYLVPAKRASRCFSSEAVFQLHELHLPQAVDSIEADLHLVRAMQKDRILISQLVASAIASMAFGPTWQALQTPGWSDAQLATLQQAWATNDFLKPGLQSLEMERAMALELIGQMRDSAAIASQAGLQNFSALANGGTGGGAFEDLAEQVGERGLELLKRGLFIPVWQFAWSSEDEMHYLGVMEEVLEGGRATAAQYSMKPSSEASKVLHQRAEKEGFYDKMRHFSSGVVVDSFAGIVARMASTQASRDLAVTAIALKRYELRHGKLPSDLGALVPEILSQIPRDIFDGNPLRYQLSEGGGFLLYSIGKDEKDDGGNPASPEKGGRASYYNGRDLVWPRPASAKEIGDFEEQEKQKARKR